MGKNFSYNKFASDLDIELDDETDDDTYLSLLEAHLPIFFALRAD